MALTRRDIERIQMETGEEHRPDFSQQTILADDQGQPIDYRELDIHHARCASTHWPAIDLTEMQASHTNFTWSYWEKTILTRANLDHANMSRSSLYDVSMPEATFREANLTDAQITNCWMEKANFGACTAPGITLRHESPGPHCSLFKTNFSYANLIESSFFHCGMHRTIFVGTNLTNAIFRFCDMRSANFTGANLTGASFPGSSLTGVNLTNADMHGTCFKNVDQLKECDLSPIQECFETLCFMRSRETIRAYQDQLQSGYKASLPVFLEIPVVPHGMAYAVEQFTHGLLPKKNDEGEVDPLWSDGPVRTILLEWIEHYLNKE